MDKIIIEGGHRLEGEVTISGAKNAALPILAATLLAPGVHTLSNVPRLVDIRTIKKLLGRLGASFHDDHGALKVEVADELGFEAPYELVKTMRASVLVLGPLVARLGKARVSLPGGCAIGARPINIHLKALDKLGAAIDLSHGYVEATVKRLRGCPIYLDFPTVTGTENIMMAATLARGTTTIKNAAREPEVIDLADYLNLMGARISGAGSDVITIEGVEGLSAAEHTIIPDRIEAGTYMVAAAATRGEVTLRGCRLDHLEALVGKLREAGVEIAPTPDGARVSVPSGGSLRGTDVKTLPYPGFPTDMQAQMMVLMCLAGGLSVITERIFENRFMHVGELRRMGADIRIEGHSAIVHGTGRLLGAPVMATDLRASASLVLAGLAAENTTEVSRVYHLDRGYEAMEQKLARLGAKVRRVME
jgi:UDP-N-acetylglucosamine 1-carboxyvinyltransferase